MAQNLDEVRAKIDSIDPKLKELIMQRLDCSYQVAEAKVESGDLTIFRQDREDAILERLGEGIPEERLNGYLAVVRKIMETSRMYQYGLMVDWIDDLVDPLVEGVPAAEDAQYIRLHLTRPNKPNAMSAILSMIGDYGYNMHRMELIEENADRVTFELVVRGNLADKKIRTLMYQLSMESTDFKILENY